MNSKKYSKDSLKTLKDIIDEHKNIALSDTQVIDLVKGQANFFIYPDLHAVSNIDQVLGEFGAVIILYLSQPHFGHYCCLIKTHDEHGPLLEFFDPYNGTPDSQLQHIPQPFRQESGQDYPVLSELLIESNYDISYNEFDFQKLDNGVKDCGRWCAMRILLKDLPLKEFSELFYNMYSDDLVTFLTTPKEAFSKIDKIEEVF